MHSAHRWEHDSLGPVALAPDALWGAQTERARLNFRITGISLASMPSLIVALAMIKCAAARSNAQIGLLTPDQASAIERACAEIIAGRHHEAFPLDVIQGGAGTSVNMNANEVIANIANEYLGGERGTYRFLHPNDHVNRSQSTNDVYPTALRLSLIFALMPFRKALNNLADAFFAKATEFRNVVKLGRTQLQDAVPMTLGQEFSAFADAVRQESRRTEMATDVLRVVNLGGTAIGTGINAPRGYIDTVLEELRRISGVDLVRSSNLFQASWDASDFVALSGHLKQIAVKISKIANDIRLLSSGPRGGLGEIRLPDMQPGSSIMPGKVNPVIPEAVSQTCFQVIGNDTATAFAAEAGQLQLNAMEPGIAWNLHASIGLLSAAAEMFAETCVRGIESNDEQCRATVHESAGLATALVPIIG